MSVFRTKGQYELIQRKPETHRSVSFPSQYTGGDENAVTASGRAHEDIGCTKSIRQCLRCVQENVEERRNQGSAERTDTSGKPLLLVNVRVPQPAEAHMFPFIGISMRIRRVTRPPATIVHELMFTSRGRFCSTDRVLDSMSLYGKGSMSLQETTPRKLCFGVLSRLVRSVA